MGTFEHVNLLSLPLGQCNTSFQGKHRQTNQSVQKQVPCAYMLILADRRLPGAGMCLHPTWQAALGRGMGDAPNPFPGQRFPGAGLTLTTHLCKPGIDLLATPRVSWSWDQSPFWGGGAGAEGGCTFQRHCWLLSQDRMPWEPLLPLPAPAEQAEGCPTCLTRVRNKGGSEQLCPDTAQGNPGKQQLHSTIRSPLPALGSHTTVFSLQVLF